MNSSKEFPVNGIIQEDSSSNSQNSSDNNANLNNSHRSKGAIPKTKTFKPLGSSKKPAKLNNNVEEMLPKCSNNLTEDVLQLHSDVLRINGFSDHLSRISGSYLDDCKSVLYGNNSDSCENCSVLCNNQYDSDIFTSKKEDCGYVTKTNCKRSAYQEGSSSSDFDIDFQLKLERESNSSDDTELLSISDDGCIYTYKGDHVADLPSSFFSLDIPFIQSPTVSPQNRENNVSPEMDFLEMDFDPGPSGDADSDSLSIGLENTESLPKNPLHTFDEETDKIYVNDNLSTDNAACIISKDDDVVKEKTVKGNTIQLETSSVSVAPSTSAFNATLSHVNGKENTPSLTSSISERIRKIRMPWSCSLSQRTTANNNDRLIRRYHCSQGELIMPCEKGSPSEDHNYTYDSTEKKISIENEDLDKFMVWSDQEASKKQVTQIGASACGATAVINVLKALRLPIPPIDKIREAVTTRLRSNSNCLAEYLLSRSVAGSTHDDLIKGLNILSKGKIYARFFHLYPERVVNLYSWLKFWISYGAVPIATLNLQKCSGTIPDAWHHQMIYGISPHSVYLTNPLECIDIELLWPQLTSESVLLIHKDDILSRWNLKNSLEQLMKINDRRWHEINVVGQVAHMIRESRKEKRRGFANSTHIKIPAAYLAGITLVMRSDSPLCSFLMYCPELPVLPKQEEASGCSDVLY